MAAHSNGVEQKYSLSQDQIQELSEVFDSIDLNGDGRIQLAELQKALEVVNIKLPQYEVRNLINQNYAGHGPEGTLSMAEFSKLYFNLKSKMDPNFLKTVRKASNVQLLEGTSEASQAIGIFHSVRNEEQIAFADWINSNLAGDNDLKHLLPLKKSGEDLYEKVSDGLILCKLINLAVPETIDERAINKKQLNAYTRLENLILVVNSARAIGCNIVNIDADDLSKAKKHLVLGLLWQIIRIGLFSQIDLIHVPGLIRLLKEGETLADLQRLSPEQILIRWVNYHLEQAGVDRRLNNFTGDVQDSEIYTYLLKQIGPPERHVTLDPLKIKGDNVKRADGMLKEADKLNCRAFVTSHDVANGVYKLNLAFVANLFNTWPGLKPPEQPQEIVDLESIQEETREERTYRNWMNSIGVDPFVNWLYSDLSNGLIIFQLYDIIKPNMVNWKNVVKQFHKFRGMMDQIQNCNYAVDLGRQLRFSLVGIQGKDLYDGNPTLTLALVWQLMRAYTLTILAHCTQSSGGSLATDKEIVDWVNKKLKNSNKQSSISSFQDPKISDAKVVIDLIDSIQPGVVDYGFLTSGNSNEVKLANAKYAISIARKIGAKVYALPEDIVEVKPKMVMTVFACLMGRDYLPNVRENVPVAAAPEPMVVASTHKSAPPPPPQRSYRIPPEELVLHQQPDANGINNNHHHHSSPEPVNSLSPRTELVEVNDRSNAGFVSERYSAGAEKEKSPVVEVSDKSLIGHRYQTSDMSDRPPIGGFSERYEVEERSERSTFVEVYEKSSIGHISDKYPVGGLHDKAPFDDASDRSHMSDGNVLHLMQSPNEKLEFIRREHEEQNETEESEWN